ncbi:GNAT family N-acetyltransferase [Streptomyces spinoverrucosus]|uniref:GNAT family N-acetyltransferase n=1 Tax=Streptomyces spinoverrucosus TaxID=284043 RepID=UPI0018C41D14|nr:GNAT family N-acetyltransferase [Streptomyces spinoverrucosus]MBG0856112.1 GNAT family N-acetyltransferase [Streptomyces spinoverrucosus]
MTTEQHSAATASLQVGGKDDDLEQRLDQELTAFNTAATGAGEPDEFSVRVTAEDGELLGGLTGWVWGGLCGVEMLWVRRDQRHTGWGSKLMRAAEDEAVRRGCTDMIVSSYTFQAPDFYLKLGFREAGRLPGVPGGHEDVYLHKVIRSSSDPEGIRRQPPAA